MKHFDPELKRYIDFYESLSPDTVNQVRKIFSVDATFIDPFNHIHGHDKIIMLFNDMFNKVEEPAFVVMSSAWATPRITTPDHPLPKDVLPHDTAGLAMLRWQFSMAGKRGKLVTIDGMSEVFFGATGRVFRHVDYWDPTPEVYEKVPLVGGIIRRVRKRIGV